MPTLPSAALTAKVIPLEGEAELSEQKAAKDAERNDSADASENIEEAKNHKGEAKQEVAAMETPTQEPEAEEFQELAFMCLKVTNPLRAMCIRAYKNPILIGFL